MAATYTHPSEISPKLQDRIRSSIKAQEIVKALSDHILDGLKMTNTQVRAAEILLRKVSPDMLATAITSDTGTALPVLQIVRASPVSPSESATDPPRSKVTALPAAGPTGTDPAPAA